MISHATNAASPYARRLGMVVLCAWAAICTPARAVETTATTGPVEVTVSLTPDEIRVGDTVDFAITATAEAGVELIMPEFSEALGRFRILDYVPSERVDANGKTVSTQRYTLQVNASGKRRIPSILVEFVDHRPGRQPAPEDFDAYEILTDAIAFEVQSVTIDSVDDELAPPMGPLAAIETPGKSSWPWTIGVLVIIAAVALLAVRPLLAARRRGKARSAYDIAVGRLQTLLAQNALDNVDAFFVELSAIARRYLEDRFGLRAPELTTEEFLEAIGSSGELTGEHRASLQAFLRQADLVKFAKAVPTGEQIDTSVTILRQFLDDTRVTADGDTAGEARHV